MNRYSRAAVFLLVGTTACRKDKLREVDYMVGCASCDVTYLNDEGTTAQQTTTGSWKYTMKVPEGRNLSLKAESNNSIGGVTVSIRVDGEPFLTQTKNDTFAVAMVAGLVP
ncbi:MAG: hypothetical protein IPG74_15095 [Flavobacteriales bacterium]|nr:hypothetical protein [Flavobacteriales bacterium]MBK7554585.1 hypothetical protein [Flavobacteriales bacterium]